MKNYIFLFLILILASCQSETDQFEIGVDLVESKTGISMVDSFSVRLSTVKIDSIATSGTTMLLAGQFNNATSGSIEVKSYFNFDLSGNLSSIDDDAIFDSITVQLHYADYLIGDSMQMQNLEVHRLKEQLRLRINNDDETYLFNTSSFKYEDQPLGQLGFYPRAENSTIEVRLDDEFGKEILQMSRDDAAQMENNTNFLDWLKGFVLKRSSISDPAMLGFSSDSTKLMLYTHMIGQYEEDEQVTEFTLSAEDTHFNQTTADRSATYFESLSSSSQREELPSAATGDMSYIQGSAGVLVRIDFPTLNEIFALENRVLLKAELILRPAIATYENDLPSVLHFYETDRINQQGDQLTYTSSSTTYSVEANLKQDQMYNENTYYIADISTFILDELSDYYYNTDHGLLISLPLTNFLSTADHLILSAGNTKNYRAQINLYFLTYE